MHPVQEPPHVQKRGTLHYSLHCSNRGEISGEISRFKHRSQERSYGLRLFLASLPLREAASLKHFLPVTQKEASFYLSGITAYSRGPRQNQINGVNGRQLSCLQTGTIQIHIQPSDQNTFIRHRLAAHGQEVTKKAKVGEEKELFPVLFLLFNEFIIFPLTSQTFYSLYN